MKISIYFYIFFYIFKQCLNYIVYPLKVFDKFDRIENLLSFDSTYTTLEVGTPPQKVDFYFSLNHTKVNLTDTGCKNMKTNINLFNRNNSSTFQNVYELDKEYQTNNTKFLVIDSIYFHYNINLTKILKVNEYPLYYSSDITNNNIRLCGNIGLSIKQYEMYGSEPYQIKYYTDYIKSYGADQNDDFSFYHCNGQDFLAYGIFLHLEFKNIFKDVKNIAYTHPMTRKHSFIFHWEISMKEFYYNNKHFKDNVIFELNPLFELIVGTNDYGENIKNDYFNSYINKQICKMEEIKNYMIFECDANRFDVKDIKKFPKLYMSNFDLHHIFELTGEELFIKINDKYYFKIVFPLKNLEPNRWIIGKIFFRKYFAIFSPANRLIGFYINPNNGKVNKKQTKKEEKVVDQVNANESSFTKDIIKYIKIFIFALIFTGLGLLLGKRIFFKRAKRANELEDDYYQYDNNVNKSDKNIDQKKKIKNNISIEMNSKLGIK